MLQAFGVDIRHLNAVEPDEIAVGRGIHQNFWGERYLYQSTPWGKMREDMPGALADVDSFAALEAFAYPTQDCMDYSQLRESCRRWEPYALLYGFADVWQRPALVRGWEAWFLDMFERPDWVHFLCNRFTEFYVEDYTRAAEMSQGAIDIYLVISDLGSQHGPLISLGMLREFVAPYLKRMVDLIHSFDAYVMFHSCGSIATFIPDLIALGIDILDPIQPTGPEMSPERLKADFGSEICFHGGIDMQQLLPHGNPDEIRAEVERYGTVLGEGGGYILAPAHLFQPDVPPENVCAVYG